PMLADPIHNIPAAHDAMDCAYHANQTWGFAMARALAEDGCDLILDGLAFDTILGSVHRVAGGDPNALAVALAANYAEVDRDSVARVAGEEAATEFMGTLTTSLKEMARECLEQAGPLASDYFVMTNRIRKYTFGYCLANMHHLAGAFPYVTRELFEHC